MVYIVLFFGVMCFLTFVTWRYPGARAVPAGGSAHGQQRTGSASRQAVDAASDYVARLLRGERKEDKPCLTPIDCVRSGRCAGHCGCR